VSVCVFVFGFTASLSFCLFFNKLRRLSDPTQAVSAPVQATS
jgi:hypothetical protein